ncbi:ATP-grasp domain-containing protein [Pseudomonas fluorescens]|uniref:ATP-grasp domain-containing protein n=1 Tax=Pseudomonas fluorescens TaxID=294 RepID=UPI002ACA2229|nr:ATP-grasp domain-containing protein [Pseudomonas fluorescens]MDZ5434589.1 ATP-grasp domain-containing protein [Pseudomonas fluorescens]
MPSCLIANPVSNANILVRYLKERGVDCYAIIELDKVAQIPKLNAKKKGEFQAELYSGIFTSEDQLPPVESCLFDAVLAGSENGVFLAEKLAAHYSLPGNDPATSFRRRHKDQMQHSLAQAGLAFIPTLVLDWHESSGPAVAEWDHFPCILKPQSSAGGEGVQRCNNRSELQQALDNASWGTFSATWTINEHFLIQPMIQGPEYVVDMVACAGEYVISSVCRYVRSDELDIDGCDFVKKFTFMLPLDRPVSQALSDYAKHAAKALDITYGAVHMELVMGDGGPVMIEAAARMHGTITPQLFVDCYDASLLEQLYEAYFGDAKNMRNAVLKAPAIVSDVICVESGVFSTSEPLLEQRLAKLSSFKGYVCVISEGDEYKPTHNLFSSPMNASFCDTDIDRLWADVTAFDQAAEHLLGGVVFSEDGWGSIRRTYDEYLAG